MNFVNTFLKKRREKKLEFYYEQYQYHYNKYRFWKKHVITFRKHTPLWMGCNSNLTSSKEESENHLKQYRYWRKKFKNLKKKMNSLYS